MRKDPPREFFEVKSSKNYTSTFYDAFKARFGKRIEEGYIVHTKSFRQTEAGYCIPSYMFFCVF